MSQVLPQALEDLALIGSPDAPLAHVLHDDTRSMPPGRNRSGVARSVVVLPSFGPEEHGLARKEWPCALGRPM
eukprot:8727527-Alexandrium_andersonii.AAC.1